MDSMARKNRLTRLTSRDGMTRANREPMLTILTRRTRMN